MLDEEIVLRNRQFYMSDPWTGPVVAIILFALILCVAMLHILKLPFTAENFHHVFMLSFTSWKWEKGIQGIIMVALYIALAVYGKRQYLAINRQGMRYVSGVPIFFRKLDDDWSLDWKQVKNVQLFLAKNNANVKMASFLYFQDGEKLRKLNPLLWVAPEKRGFFSSIQWRQFRNLDNQEFLNRVNETPLLKTLFLKNIAVNVVDVMPGKAKAFDLESNIHSKVMMVLMVLLFTYAFFEYLFIKQIYTHDVVLPLIEAVILVLLIAFISIWWMKEGNVPLLESIGVAVLFAGALSCAMYFVLLRLNGVTDSHAQLAHYQMKTPGHFTALNSSLPDFDYFSASYYWDYIHKGDDCVFILQKGALGFYQVDVTIVDKITNVYYDEYKSQPKDMKLNCDFSGK